MSEHFESGDPAENLMTQMLAAREQARESILARAAYLDAVAALGRSNPFVPLRYDLSGSGVQTFSGTCFAIHYRREGSVAGGKLDLDINGKLECIYPGSVVEGIFDRFSVARNSRSCVKGPANLLVVAREDARFREPSELPGQLHEPVDLLGVSSAGTFVALQTAVPSGIGQSGGFNATGWSRIRVLIDGATALTDFQLNPWVWEPTLAAWHAQTTQDAVTVVSDTEVTGGLKRVIVFDIDCTGLMFFQLSDNTSGNAVSAIVQGIR